MVSKMLWRNKGKIVKVIYTERYRYFHIPKLILNPNNKK